MGQYSGFVARYKDDEKDSILGKLKSSGIDKITVYEELHLIVGIVKSDRDRGAFVALIECGIDDFRGWKFIFYFWKRN